MTQERLYSLQFGKKKKKMHILALAIGQDEYVNIDSSQCRSNTVPSIPKGRHLAFDDMVISEKYYYLFGSESGSVKMWIREGLWSDSFPGPGDNERTSSLGGICTNTHILSPLMWHMFEYKKKMLMQHFVVEEDSAIIPM